MEGPRNVKKNCFILDISWIYAHERCVRRLFGFYCYGCALMNFFSKNFLEIYNCSLKVGERANRGVIIESPSLCCGYWNFLILFID